MRILMFLMVVTPPLTFAQAVQTPPPVYSGSFGGGFAVTNGNSETKNFNLTFAMVRDPKTNNVMKVNALYLRGDQDGRANIDRTSLNVRDEWTLSGRTFVFGQLDYLRDRFKEIDYLIAPNGGVGYRVLAGDRTVLSVDAGAGGIWEKNPIRPVRSSGTINVGERFQSKISSTATLTQSVATIWKTQDFADSLTTFALGLTTSVTSRLEVKFEFLDSYKNRPPGPTIKKNDQAFVTSFVVKF